MNCKEDLIGTFQVCPKCGINIPITSEGISHGCDNYMIIRTLQQLWDLKEWSRERDRKILYGKDLEVSE